MPRYCDHTNGIESTVGRKHPRGGLHASQNSARMSASCSVVSQS